MSTIHNSPVCGTNHITIKYSPNTHTSDCMLLILQVKSDVVHIGNKCERCILVNNNRLCHFDFMNIKVCKIHWTSKYQRNERNSHFNNVILISTLAFIIRIIFNIHTKI